MIIINRGLYIVKSDRATVSFLYVSFSFVRQNLTFTKPIFHYCIDYDDIIAIFLSRDYCKLF